MDAWGPGEAGLLLLVDEVMPAARLAFVAAAYDFFRNHGMTPQVLHVPCPSQPRHPRVPEHGSYRFWMGGLLPAHGVAVATSWWTAALAGCISEGTVYWLMDAEPDPDEEDSPCAESVGELLGSGAVIPLVAGRSLAEALRRRWNSDAEVVAIRPGNSNGTAGRQGGTRRGIVVDHSSHSTESVGEAAAAMSGIGERTVLLTDGVRVPYADAFDEVRVAPLDRRPYYEAARIVVKPDGFRESAFRLSSILRGGGALVVREASMGELLLPGVRHGVEVWVIPLPDPVTMRGQIELLLAHTAVCEALGARGRAAAARTERDEGAGWHPRARPPVDRAAAMGILAHCAAAGPRQRANGTVVDVLRRLAQSAGIK